MICKCGKEFRPLTAKHRLCNDCRLNPPYESKEYKRQANIRWRQNKLDREKAYQESLRLVNTVQPLEEKPRLLLRK